MERMKKGTKDMGERHRYTSLKKQKIERYRREGKYTKVNDINTDRNEQKR